MIQLELLGDGTVTDRNFQTLRALVLDTGGITAGVRFGVHTFSFVGGVVVGPDTIAHGLGRTPVAVFVGNALIPGVATVTGHHGDGSTTDTEFDAYAVADVGFTDDVELGWAVIG